ncbi:hypothetical protein AeNC1_001272 [Aphanomyces euteiches]|nr:hypothetical protein AeNC1_001272 [Aphanomyces euteiches]
MRCHYEVLQVERDISSSDLRKAFHKLALKWHPDKIKEGQDVEEATQVFQEIQSAYVVLSDAQERAWYDDHREQILRGDGGHAPDEEDDRFDVMRYFSTSVYSGFKDDDRGFYSVYRGVFEEIDALDREARGDNKHAPSFGTSTSDVPLDFYDYWRAYMTDQSFSWLDQYKTTDAPTREIRRLMEKDNKKLRDAGKKTFNANVRALVDFVRKRDKRMIQFVKEKEAQKALQQAEKERAAAARKQAYKAERAQFQASWEADEAAAYSSHVEAQVRDEVAKRQAKAEAMILVCDICKKEFKSEKQVQNHLVSKKHREQMILAGLDPSMLDELLELEASTAANSAPNGSSRKKDEDEDEDEEDNAASRSQPKKPIVSLEEEEQKRREREEKERKAAEKRMERKEKRKAGKKEAPSDRPKGADKATTGKDDEKGDDEEEFACGSCSMAFPTLKTLQKHLKKERHTM